MLPSLTLLVSRANSLSGECLLPGDKSISHRALIFSAISENRVTIDNLLVAEDVLATQEALKSLGVQVVCDEQSGQRTVVGVGLGGLSRPLKAINLGNSGTSIRLLAGLLSAQPFESVCIGDASLSKRPMGRVITPLRRMGAQISGVVSDKMVTAPLKIVGVPRLKGISYDLPMPSAQVASAILLAGLYAEGNTRVSGLGIARDHTQRMLSYFGYQSLVEQKDAVCIKGGGRLLGRDIIVPGDFSSAAFFIVAASIIPGSDVVFRKVGVNPGRTGLLTILKAMGADITLFNPCLLGDEPAADIRVRFAKLSGVRVPDEWVAAAIDEFPVLMVAAACATGVTIIRGAKELRVKECDRIQVMIAGLNSLGVKAVEYPDGARIEGGSLIKGGVVDSKGDHRIAMAFAVLGALVDTQLTVTGASSIATSFPQFVTFARQLGFVVTLQ